MACIYTLGVQPGTVERNNLCRDVRRDDEGHGGSGIYTDEGSSNLLIENNVIFRAQDGGFQQHCGRDNVVRNNIFALGQTAEVPRTREEGHPSFTFERNIVYWRARAFCSCCVLLDGRLKFNSVPLGEGDALRSRGLGGRFELPESLSNACQPSGAKLA